MTKYFTLCAYKLPLQGTKVIKKSKIANKRLEKGFPSGISTTIIALKNWHTCHKFIAIWK